MKVKRMEEGNRRKGKGKRETGEKGERGGGWPCKFVLTEAEEGHKKGKSCSWLLHAAA